MVNIFFALCHCQILLPAYPARCFSGIVVGGGAAVVRGARTIPTDVCHMFYIRWESNLHFRLLTILWSQFSMKRNDEVNATRAMKNQFKVNE